MKSRLEDIKATIDSFKTRLAVMENQESELKKDLRKYKIVTLEDAIKVRDKIEKEINDLEKKAEKLLSMVEEALEEYD